MGIGWIRVERTPCQYCRKIITKPKMQKHLEVCDFAPNNYRECIICKKPTKNKRITCSRSCANKHFRTGINHGNWKEDAYQTTCFAYHERKCVICDETRILDVHHLDENRSNNKPENLIPLCPTHHRYWHSRFKNLIEEQIIQYISEWKNKQTGQK